MKQEKWGRRGGEGGARFGPALAYLAGRKVASADRCTIPQSTDSTFIEDTLNLPFKCSCHLKVELAEGFPR